jgi:hypothetical protein
VPSFSEPKIRKQTTIVKKRHQRRSGTNACVELEPGVWNMITGDADGDGKITPVDPKIVEQQKGKKG